jgi:uncharacterized membrane protein
MKLKKAIVIINSILLIIIILISPLSYYIFNFDHYNNLYEKNGVYKVLDDIDVLVITTSVFNFFKYGTEFKKFELKSNINYFADNEISHLEDVRILLIKIFILYYLSIFLIVILTILLIEKNIFKFFKNIGLIFTVSSSSVIIMLIILYFLGNNFPNLFENFHQIFFPQGNYTFTWNSLIITIFPFGFFYDFFIKIVMTAFIISIILFIIGISVIIFFRVKKEVK